jgi:nucleotide-binding universal stress UspA family protein
MSAEQPGDAPRIVAGVDGSEASLQALAFAAEEASLRGAQLDVVYAYVSPMILGASMPQDYFDQLDAGAREELDAVIAQVPSVSGVAKVERRAIPERPAEALIAASHGAVMLVVGSRGQGGFASLLLGSVSSQCAQHASCPVVIVRSAPHHG